MPLVNSQTGEFHLSLFLTGLWKVCEKYRKLMNELAQVSNYAISQLGFGQGIHQAFWGEFSTLLTKLSGLILLINQY